MEKAKKTGTKETGGKPGARKKGSGKKRRSRTKLTVQEVTTERYLTLITGWYMDGATNQDVADRLHISRDTLHRWSKISPELAEAMKCSREIADYKVENSLYKKALGYTVQLSKPMKVRIDDYDEATGKRKGSHEEIVETVEEVHFPADTAAIIFWLKNRLPGKWRQKDRDSEVKESEGGVVMLPAVLSLDDEDGGAEDA